MPFDACPDRAVPARRAAQLAALSLGVVVVQVDVTVVNVALDQIQDLMQGGVAGLQWVVNGYTLAFASLLLTGGALGDRYGARRLYLAGFALFTLASLACGLAPTGAVLIAARVAQGLGGALLMPCSLALVAHAYHDPGERMRAIGIWAGAGGMAMVAGPVVGGVLVALFGWRSIFLINLPIGVVGLWLTLRFTTETEGRHKRALDLPGQLLAIVALVALTGSIIEGEPLGWTHPLVLGGAALFLLSGIGFLLVESRSAAPMMPLGLFRHPVFSAISLIGFLLNAGYYGATFLLSLYFQGPLGLSPLLTGLAFVPMTGLIAVINVFAGRVAARHGARLPMVSGLCVAVTGFAALALVLTPATDYGGLWWTLLLIGCGTALTVPPMTAALLATVDRARSGIASGVLNSLRQTGGAIGVAVLGAIGGGGMSVEGMRLAMGLSGGVLVLALLAAVVWVRKPSG
ncbi:MFS transporter [Mycobacterium sp. KBS0706]|uniref:MFS transporter n=1 Tax=Mycobacterium sp. KBS0706 TaxID=2578109 RepID=UPI00110FF0FE|nr:MFS transporter [Mycobacterium sp. KBS0706]TSD84295.1 MFS transporter [Mycobacterium sp. KBS0706]